MAVFRTLNDIDVKDKRVLVRVDFNVPLDKNGEVSDDARIQAALPTIRHLLKNGATVVLVTHLGRPKGVDETLRLDAVADRLSELLKKDVRKMDDCVGPPIEIAVRAAEPGSVILLENVRFYPEEEKNDPEFAKKLARMADIYVNDAFGTAHRAHASTEGVAHLLPSAAGFLLEKEIKMLSAVLDNPAHPFVAVIGGAKVSDKIGVISNLLKRADAILIGGAMMFTFAKATGKNTGKSLVENDKLDLARDLLKQGKGRIMLPVDTIVAHAIDKAKGAKNVPMDGVPADLMGVDIGEETIKIYSEVISKAKMVAWNGPMGVAEVPQFAKGTLAIAKAMAKVKGTTIVGGGETGEAVRKAKVEKRLTHVSTGGGASLEFLEGKKLPGIAALEANVEQFNL